ncbi:MAG: hypothetical protein Q3966_08065 [Neisseria sp.]|nr:hypothetical protein [Neisseria sp.]
MNTEETAQRSRAWRRMQKNKPSHQAQKRYYKERCRYCLEKDWGMMYFRSEKIRRAKQLRFTYPFRREDFAAEWLD